MHSHFYDRQVPFVKIHPAQMQLQEWQVKSEVPSCILYSTAVCTGVGKQLGEPQGIIVTV